MSAGSFALSLTVVLTLFLLLNPFWKPMDAAAADQNIGWSYAPIPLLVAFFLLLEKKWRPAAFFIETMRLTFVKFAITWVAANLYWAVAGLPEPLTRSDNLTDLVAPAGEGLFVEREVPETQAVDQQGTVALRGQVLDAEGQPLAGAMVFVSKGLEGWTSAPPPEPLVMDCGPEGFTPQVAIVHAFQSVVLRGDDELHSAQVVNRSGRVLFTYALLPGLDKRLMFGRSLGLVQLLCTVHEETEAPSTLLVLSHSFAGFTDGQGRFDLGEVPLGTTVSELEVSAWSASRSGLSRCTPTAGETLELTITVAGSSS